MIAPNIIWPIYTVTLRESVNVENGVPVVVDFEFLATGQAVDDLGKLIDEFGLVLFSSAKNAEVFLEREAKPEYAIATFTNKNQLISCLQHLMVQRFRLIVFDRYADGKIIPIDNFISMLERQL